MASIVDLSQSVLSTVFQTQSASKSVRKFARQNIAIAAKSTPFASVQLQQSQASLSVDHPDALASVRSRVRRRVSRANPLFDPLHVDQRETKTQTGSGKSDRRINPKGQDSAQYRLHEWDALF